MQSESNVRLVPGEAAAWISFRGMVSMSSRSQSWKNVVIVGVLTAIYFSAGKLGLMLASVHASASPVWPATGIALAALLLLGYRVWPGIFLGAFLV